MAEVPTEGNVPPTGEGEKKSKAQLKKEAKAKAKAEKSAAGRAKQQSTQQKPEEERPDLFGVLPLHRSQTPAVGKEFVRISNLNESKKGTTVSLRARVHTTRGAGNLCFLLIRQRDYRMQALVNKSEKTPKSMVNFAQKLHPESIVYITGELVEVAKPIDTATPGQQKIELHVTHLFVESTSEPTLPLQLADAERPRPILQAQKERVKAIEAEIAATQKKLAAASGEEKEQLQKHLEELQKKKEAAQEFVILGRNKRLDNRVVDLRTAANQAIFKIQSGVCTLFREYLLSQGFMEIHSPKILGAGTEGGAEVFKLDYFGHVAFLAQSPQFYKQMAICADMERVFEIGPVFRAEHSNTQRHLCEFTGLDFEMTIREHYHEVLDALESLFFYIFDGLSSRYEHEIKIVSQQYPFEPIKYARPSVRLDFREGVRMLREAGVTTQSELEDLGREEEKLLGKLVKEKYGQDFYMLDRYPTSARPFYTMPCVEDERYTNSYDLFIRAEEIVSGSQRVHDPELLTARAIAKEVNPKGIKGYIDSFRFGAPPHGGAGIGLERVVKLFLGLNNVRGTSLFPRTPTRLEP